MADEEDFRRAAYDARYDRESDDYWEPLIILALGVALVAGLLFGAAGWLDHEFGWHLQAWFREHLNLG